MTRVSHLNVNLFIFMSKKQIGLQCARIKVRQLLTVEPQLSPAFHLAVCELLIAIDEVLLNWQISNCNFQSSVPQINVTVQTPPATLIHDDEQSKGYAAEKSIVRGCLNDYTSTV